MDVDVGVGVVDVDVDVDNLGDNERGDLSGAVDGDEGVDDNVDGDGHVGVMRSESVEDEGMDGMDEMGKYGMDGAGAGYVDVDVGRAGD